MPVYEYRCRKCSNEFETLVRGQMVPACPKCSSEDLERLLSLPAVQSEGTHALAMKAARQRDKRQGFEREQAQREYEASHED